MLESILLERKQLKIIERRQKMEDRKVYIDKMAAKLKE
jgi:hypothetical protein